MRVFLFVILCSVASNDVVAEGENEIKRGTHPFMALLYYPDEMISDITGERFTRGGVLISNVWIITSGDVSLAFPKKTLLARLGAIAIDTKFTLNEDEEEQEREVILIIRPYNYSTTEWWNTDISLVKTLLPFNTTLTVASTALPSYPVNVDKTCFILIYTRKQNNSTERILTQMYVDLLPSTQENCGSKFRKETMVCASDSEDKTNPVADPNFCQGNSGGPLICDTELAGTQTYSNDCKPPHLYQLVTGWSNLISCAKEERYLAESCANICTTLSKDPLTSPVPEILIAETPKLFEIISETLGNIVYTQSNAEKPTATAASKEDTTVTIKLEIMKSTVAETNEQQMSNNESYMKPNSPDTTNGHDTADSHNTINSHDTTNAHETSSHTIPETNTKEESMDSMEERDRKNKIEAQHHLVRNNAFMNIPLFHYLVSSLAVAACFR